MVRELPDKTFENNTGEWHYNTENTRHFPNAVPMFGHRLRRWTNIDTALGDDLISSARGVLTFCVIYVEMWAGLTDIEQSTVAQYNHIPSPWS